MIARLIKQLQDKGWTKAAIGAELGVPRQTVDAWSKHRQPAQGKLVEEKLTKLLSHKRIPKQKLYKK